MPGTQDGFDCDAFVDELTKSVADAGQIPTADQHENSAAFQVWRRRAQALIDKAEQSRYPIESHLRERHFSVGAHGRVRDSQNHGQWKAAMADTMTEFKTIIENFNRRGRARDELSPGGMDTTSSAAVTVSPAQAATHAGPPSPRQPLAYTKEATVGWYLRNTPASTLLAVLAFQLTIAAGAFGLGMAFTGTRGGKALIEWFSPAAIATSAASAAHSAGSAAQTPPHPTAGKGP